MQLGGWSAPVSDQRLPVSECRARGLINFDIRDGCSSADKLINRNEEADTDRQASSVSLRMIETLILPLHHRLIIDFRSTNGLGIFICSIN
jgi:hypothetical protein